MDNIVVLDAINELGQNIDNTRTFNHKGNNDNTIYNFYTMFEGYYTFIYTPSNESYWYYNSFDKKETVYVGNIPRTVYGIQFLDTYGYGTNSNTANYKTITKNFLTLTNIQYPNSVQSENIFLPKNSNIRIIISSNYNSRYTDGVVNMGVLNICGSLQYVNINTVPLFY